MFKKIVVLMGLAIFAAQAFGGEMEREITFQASDLSFSKSRGYDIVSLPGASLMMEVGSPILPRISVKLLIPPGATSTKVEIISYEKEIISGDFNIFPAQPPMKIGAREIPEFVEPNPAVYESKEPYPGKLVSDKIHNGTKCGYRIADFFIYPLEYIPKEKKLILYTKIRYRIYYEEGKWPVKKITQRQKELFGKNVKSMVINPEDIEHWSPPVGINRGNKLSPDTVEYVIIAPNNAAWVDSLQVLADWKTKKGIPARVVRLDSIYSWYSGNNQWKLKQFIIDAHNDWGTNYVFLVGDVDSIPHRGVYVTIVQQSETYTDMPSERYYEDLDNDWNYDDDSYYGEKNDGPGGGDIDWYADVYVGRAPIDNVTQAGKIVSRILKYEKDPHSYTTKALFFSDFLFDSNNGYYTTDSCETHIPDTWFTGGHATHPGWHYEQGINNYQSDHAIIDSMNSGYGFHCTASHGGYSSIMAQGIDNDINISSTDVNNWLNPGDKLGIHTGICCLSGGFDQSDCYAEWEYYKGGIGAAYNSREGWGYSSAGNPAWYANQLSNGIVLQFFKETFDNNRYHLGEAVAEDRDHFGGNINDPGDNDYWRWCLFEYNTFGDPELPMWTAANGPDTLQVNHDVIVPIGLSSFDVHVEDKGTGNPIDSALVCCWCKVDTGMWVRGYTNSSGNVTLDVSPSEPVDTMWVTVTKQNYLPYEGFARIEADCPDVPTLYALFDNEKVPDKKPTFKFSTTDPNGDPVQYQIRWDEDINFGSPDSDLTGTHNSGETATYTLTTSLSHDSTYWWKVRAKDPAKGSGYYGGWSEIRSFTVDTTLPRSAWYIGTGEQFENCDRSGVIIQGDSVVIALNKPDTLIEEGFESSFPPTGWVENTTAGRKHWEQDGGATDGANDYHSGSYSAWITYRFWFEQITAWLITPQVDLSTLEDAKLVFWEKENYNVDHEYHGIWYSTTDQNPSSFTQITEIGKAPEDAWAQREVSLPLDSPVYLAFKYDGTYADQWWVDDVIIIGLVKGDSGLIKSPYIAYDDFSSATSWDSFIWHQATEEDSIRIQIEYLSAGSWSLVPDTNLPGNSTGFFTTSTEGGIDISGLDTTTYDTLRLVSTFIKKSAKAATDPSLVEWEVRTLGAEATAVKLVYFEALVSLDGVVIRWRTESEIDNYEWWIERSIVRDSNYERIAIIKGEGTSSKPREYSYVDKNVEEGETYYYRVIDVDQNGNQTIHGTVSVTVFWMIPKVFALRNAYPNPSSDETTIRYEIPQKSYVSLKVYDISGRLVKTLVNEKKIANYHTVRWDGKNGNGREVGSGVYFYRLQAGDKTATKKLVLVR